MLRGEIYFGRWLFPNKAVADISHSIDINVRLVFDFASESTYMDVYRPIPAKIVFAPDLIEQGIAGENPAGMAGEEFQQFVFLERQ